MIVDLDDTTTTAVNKKLDELREKVGAVTMGRVLTLIIAPDSEEVLEDSLKAANDASQRSPLERTQDANTRAFCFPI